MCSARFGEERLIERAFISCGYSLEIEVMDGRPAVESECTCHPLSERLLVGVMMRPKNGGVAHLRAFRKFWEPHTWARQVAQEAQGQNAARNISGTHQKIEALAFGNDERHKLCSRSVPKGGARDWPATYRRGSRRFSTGGVVLFCAGSPFTCEATLA